MTTNARPTARRNGIAARLALVSLTALATATLVTACGGGSGGGTSVTPDRCTVNDEKQFVLDAARAWYLFPELLPANVNIGNYATADDLLDALTAQARAQGKDRFFSYLTTREADQALFGEGEFIGFGFRTLIKGDEVFLIDVFEDTPAADAGLTRGVELLAIDEGSGYVAVATILTRNPALSREENLSRAFGSNTVGVQRGFRYRLPGDTTEDRPDLTLTKRLNTITPIPVNDGINDGVRELALPSNPSVKVGYVALRTFISTARTPLIDAFAKFQDSGISYFIVDLRYNGGGLVSVGELLGDLFGRGLEDRRFSGIRYNPSRASANDENRDFQPIDESVQPSGIAFITTGSTASASEMIINSMDAHVPVAIIGSDTFGKPVGQDAFDLSGCDTRLRLVTFRTVNAQDRGDYYNGLADELFFSCEAADDVSRPMGDPAEASTAAALGWLENSNRCPAMTAATGMAQLKLAPEAERSFPVPERPDPAQLLLPGLF